MNKRWKFSQIAREIVRREEIALRYYFAARPFLKVKAGSYNLADERDNQLILNLLWEKFNDRLDEYKQVRQEAAWQETVKQALF